MNVTGMGLMILLEEVKLSMFDLYLSGAATTDGEDVKRVVGGETTPPPPKRRTKEGKHTVPFQRPPVVTNCPLASSLLASSPIFAPGCTPRDTYDYSG